MNQFPKALIVTRTLPRSILQQQVAGIKKNFGNEKFNEEVSKQEDKMKTVKHPDPLKVNLDTANATSNSQKQYNKEQSLKEKYESDSKNTDNSQFRNKDSKNKTSDSGQNQNKDYKKSQFDSIKGNANISQTSRSPNKEINKPGSYERTDARMAPTSSGVDIPTPGCDFKSTTTSGMQSKPGETKNTTSRTQSYVIITSLLIALTALIYSLSRKVSGSATAGIGNTGYAKEGEKTAKTSTTGRNTDTTSRTGDSESQTYEYVKEKKSIPESIKDSAKAYVDAAKKEYYKDQDPNTSNMEKPDRTFTERVSDTAKAAKDAAKDTYNKDREAYPSSSTTDYGSSPSTTSSRTGPNTSVSSTTSTGTVEPKKEDQTILESIKDTAKNAMHAILGKDTETKENEKIKYEDPSTKGTSGGYKVDRERAESDSQKMWDPSINKSDEFTNRTVYKTDESKSEKKKDTLPDLKDKGV